MEKPIYHTDWRPGATAKNSEKKTFLDEPLWRAGAPFTLKKEAKKPILIKEPIRSAVRRPGATAKNVRKNILR